MNQPTHTTVRLTLIVLALLGLAISGYLAYAYIARAHIPCATGWLSGCTAVQLSSYAQLVSIPIPVYGVALYLFIIVDQLLLLSWHRNKNWHRFFGATLLLGFAFSLYLTAIEAFVIRAWCVWCVGSAILATLLFAIWTASKQYRRSLRETHQEHPTPNAEGLGG